MDKQIDKLINHIRDLENRLGEVDNNLRYIKVVQALKHSLDKLDDMLRNNCIFRSIPVHIPVAYKA